MKKILILVGPKGAGKSTIGQLLATELGLHFLRVEPLFLQVRAELGASHPDFEPRGLATVLASVKEALSLHDIVCIESTGASAHLPGFLDEASRLGQVLLVRVLARPDQCLERIRTRDTSIHIPVSDDQIQRINALAVSVDLPWAAQLDNRGTLDPPGICRTISGVIAD